MLKNRKFLIILCSLAFILLDILFITATRPKVSDSSSPNAPDNTPSVSDEVNYKEDKIKYDENGNLIEEGKEEVTEGSDEPTVTPLPDVVSNDENYSNHQAGVYYSIPEGITLKEDNNSDYEGHSLVKKPFAEQTQVASYSSDTGEIVVKVIPFVYDENRMSEANRAGVVMIDDSILDYIVTNDTSHINAELNDIEVESLKLGEYNLIKIAYTYEGKYHVDYCVPYTYNFFVIQGVKSNENADIESDMQSILATLQISSFGT